MTLADGPTAADLSFLSKLLDTVPGLSLLVGLLVVTILFVRYVWIPLWDRWEITAKTKRDHEKAMAIAHQAGWSSAEKFGACLKDVTNDLINLKSPGAKAAENGHIPSRRRDDNSAREKIDG